jgi:dipeptidyl aminopeptidase/acylaminoacyl peptidase
VLFIHGDDDRNVDISQTVDLVQRLRKTDVKFEEMMLVDETHSIKRHSNVLKMNDATVEFLDRHLMPGKAGR